MVNLAALSFHGCPVARLGEKDTGGMNVYVLQMARELAAKGHRVDVFTRCHDPHDDRIVELCEGARVVHLDAGPLSESKQGLFRHIPEFVDNLLDFVRSEGRRYDLIHSHYWLSGRIGMEVGRLWGVPHLTTFHTLALAKLRAHPAEDEAEMRLSVEGEVMDAVDGVVVSTEQESEDLRRLYGLTSERVHVVTPGVDLDLFRPGDRALARERLGLADEPVILYVGRIEPLKGLDILIEAVSMLDAAGSRLLVVGGTPGRDAELERLRRRAHDLGIAERVTFTGALKQTDLPDYYRAADVFVLPSYSESFGLVALEAMACATPVVASRVGGLKTFILDGHTGYLIPWHCPEPFAQRIDMLLSNPPLRETMGAAAAEHARTMSWGISADSLSRLYSRLLAAPVESLART